MTQKKKSLFYKSFVWFRAGVTPKPHANAREHHVCSFQVLAVLSKELVGTINKNEKAAFI